MIKWIKNIFKRIFKRKTAFVKLPNQPIVEAFELNGTKYYQYTSPFGMPVMRAMVATDVYAELEMNCDRNFLLLHSKAVNEILFSDQKSSAKIKELVRLNAIIEERLKWIFTSDLLYKLASIVFFDDTENPQDYDLEYAKRKIKLWKTQDMDAFFLQLPISSLLPFLNISDIDLKTYTQSTSLMTANHLQVISALLSKSKLSSDLQNYLTSQMPTQAK